MIGVGLAALGLADGCHFTSTVNATRSANDIVVWSPEAAALAAPKVHPALAFLRWQLPPIVPYGPAHLRDLANGTSLRNFAAFRFTNECLDGLVFFERNFYSDRDIEPSTTIGVRLQLENLS